MKPFRYGSWQGPGDRSMAGSSQGAGMCAAYGQPREKPVAAPSRERRERRTRQAKLGVILYCALIPRAAEGR